MPRLWHGRTCTFTAISGSASRCLSKLHSRRVAQRVGIGTNKRANKIVMEHDRACAIRFSARRHRHGRRRRFVERSCRDPAIAVFLPCYLLVVIPARYFRRSVHDPRVKAFVDGVTAAAAGAIAGAGFVLGRRAIFDLPTALIALLALAALTRLKGVSEPVLILAAGVVGIAVTITGS